MMEIEPRDRLLLELLRQNSRTSTSALARELGVSRSTVQDRINRLERRKIIAGYTIRYDEAYSERQISAHVMIQVNPKKSRGIEQALANISAVKTLQTVSGIYDFVTTIEAATTEEMDRVLDRVRDLQGVEKTTTSIVLSTKFAR